MFHNCVLWGNTAPEAGTGAIYNHFRATAKTDVTASAVQGGWLGAGNLDVDPLFVDPTGGDFRLASNSPCRDGGVDSALLVGADSGVSFDLAMGARIVGPTVDMGAFEVQPE